MNGNAAAGLCPLLLCGALAVLLGLSIGAADCPAGKVAVRGVWSFVCVQR